MMRLTRPISDEADYHPFLLVGLVLLYVSEDAGYHYDGNTGALLSGGAPTNNYKDWRNVLLRTKK